MHRFIAWLLAVASFVPFATHAQEAQAPAAVDAHTDYHANYAQRTLHVFAGQQRSMRMAAGYSGLISGAGAIGAGLLADLEYEQDYGQPLWIIGGVVFLSGGIALFAESSLESFADEHRGDAPDALQRAWAQAAREQRMSRTIGGIIGLSLGAISAGAGALIAADAFGLDEQPKQDWSVALLIVGSSLIGGSVSTMLVESPTEHGYRVAYGSGADEPSARLAISGAASGMTVGVSGRW